MIVDKFGQTALHLATAGDFAEVVQKLLSHPKINPNIKNKDELTPVMLASIKGKEKALKVTNWTR